MSKQKITMTIDEKVFAAFKRTCNSNAMKVSSRVELMMQEFIEQKFLEDDNSQIKNKQQNIEQLTTTTQIENDSIKNYSVKNPIQIISEQKNVIQYEPKAKIKTNKVKKIKKGESR